MSVNPLTGSGVALAGAHAHPSTHGVAHGGKTGAKDPKAAEAAKLEQAAQQFEAVFVRHLLKSSKITEGMGESGYGGMALEALADGVTKGGGLGLAKAIADSIRHSELSHRAPPKAEKP